MSCLARKVSLCLMTVLAGSSVYAQAPQANLGMPDVLIVAQGMSAQQRDMLTKTAQGLYRFWNTNNPELLKSSLSPSFMDRALPPGRPQGPTGPLYANTQFRKAVPDLHCEVTQQIVAGDRVVSHLRFTGHFTGTYGSIHGMGQNVDFIATDILRIVAGRITDNWHLEDNLTFQQQIGAIKR